jgi:hypothetical protein
MKIRTRAFLLGLIPALLMASVLTAFHVYSRLAELDRSLSQQGMALARHLAASAEYGVVSGNDDVLDMLLDQAMSEQGVESALLVWPRRSTHDARDGLGRLAAGDRRQPLGGPRSLLVRPSGAAVDGSRERPLLR